MMAGRMNFSRRLILPAAGMAIFLLAYLAQNVWSIFHVEDVSRAMRSLSPGGLVLGMAVLGFVEGTVLLCFYVPGTAVAIVLLLALSPGWADAMPLLLGLMAGTMAGYVLSLALGRMLQERLPALVGEAYFRKVQSLIERFGVVSFIVVAIHPNQLAVAFAILGYFRTSRVWRYFVTAAIMQAAWWAIFASMADVVAQQNLVTSSNFQLYVAALFLAWFVYELFSRPHPVNVP
jgi:membrane protein DedA with SNARE-associated domain